MEKALLILSTGSIDSKFFSETHPPTLARRDALRTAVTEAFGKEKSAGIISLSKIVEEIIKYLWENIEPAIFNLYRNNVRPSSHWQ